MGPASFYLLLLQPPDRGREILQRDPEAGVQWVKLDISAKTWKQRKKEKGRYTLFCERLILFDHLFDDAALNGREQ